MRSIFSTAPGTGGQRWTASPRGPPYFHTPSRPYSFGVEVPRSASMTLRDDGLDEIYDQTRGTLDEGLRTSGRRYASAFTAGLPRLKPMAKGLPGLGPGSYTLPEDAMCGGVRVLREPFRPTSNFAPRVGGKFAHLGDSSWW